MSCKLGKATRAPFDLWQGEHTIVTEDKPKAEVDNFKDDYNNETDEHGEPVRIPIVKPLSAVAHIDLNNTAEDDPINIVIKIENLTATFIVSSGSGEEDNHQAVLVDEPTPVGGTAADNHSHTRSQTVSQPARIFNTSAANLPTPSSQLTSTITTTRTSNAASGSCNTTTINSITTTTTNNSNNTSCNHHHPRHISSSSSSATACPSHRPLRFHPQYPTGGRRQDAGWDSPTEPYLHKPDIQPDFLEKVKTKTYETNNQLRRHNQLFQQQQQQDSSSATSFLTPTHHHPNGNSFRNPWPSAI
ncbi:hypothetical protein PPACK8108_LOCUS3393 [Phakopsora pachyrhizi]|uniref:Uncharacterized protein n=1 Tax=Phakopsora pachyrhizi TaxID=170000 RepID=A0AAV0ALJ0_PHAPC|nr:hypothetical protein PPACK8108_LOCUS3393 [Phakopsora pachyrhizi]